MKRAILLLALIPSLAWPCSLVAQPANEEQLSSVQFIPALVDGGSDTAPPVKPVVSGLVVTLFRNPCDGRGSACPQLDTLKMTVSTGDDHTPVERLRYVAYFGATSADVVSAVNPQVIFSPDFTSPNTITAYLGVNRLRSGDGFRKATLCFALAAVDEAANVSERSDATCVNTIDEGTAVMVDGAPCVLGCGGCSGAGEVPFVLLAVGALLRRRRR